MQPRPGVVPEPDEIVLDRFPNPHAAFGLGVHRCIGSNLARLDFKYMLREVLRRMPDYRIDHAGREQYESIGTINGFKHLPATFTPGRARGAAAGRGDGRLAGATRRRTRAREPPRDAKASADGARVVVDPELCQGHTLCNMAAPDIFHLRDEDGHAYVVVDDLTPEQVPLARRRPSSAAPSAPSPSRSSRPPIR